MQGLVPDDDDQLTEFVSESLPFISSASRLCNGVRGLLAFFAFRFFPLWLLPFSIHVSAEVGTTVASDAPFLTDKEADDGSRTSPEPAEAGLGARKAAAVEFS